MIDYKKVLDLTYKNKKSSREIAQSEKCSKTKVADFLRRFEACDKELLSYPLSPDITNEAIYKILYQSKGRKEQVLLYREVDCEKVLQELKKKGHTIKREWRLYNQEGVVNGKKPYGYRQFCQKLADWVSTQEVIGHIVRRPGENMELDYAGMQLYLKSPTLSGDDIPVTIFVASLTYSDYFYAEGFLTGDEATWLRLCNNALWYFGGATPVTTPDNCKVAVEKNKDWIDPTINKAFDSWADYYSTAILPAAVRSPRWKPVVENSVGVVTRDILVDMSEQTYYSLEELNTTLFRKVEERNRVNLTNKNFSRYDLYVNEELPLLMPLPQEPFELLQRKEATVHPDLSVRFDGNYYTMHKKYVGDAVVVEATSKLVTIRNEFGDELKTYPRSYEKGVWIYDEETKPRTPSDYSWWSPDYFLTQASAVGPNTHYLIEVILNTEKIFKNKVFRRCYGILSFAKKYGNEVLEACATKALEVGRPNYSYIRDTIADFSVSGDEVKEEEPEHEMKYKVDDSKYSLERLTRMQEENLK